MSGGAALLAAWSALALAGCLGHLVGDYLLQSDRMARQKVRPLDRPGTWPALVAHAGLWGLTIAAFWLPVAWVAWGPAAAGTTIAACALLACLHGVQDRRWPVLAWMDRMGQEQKPWLVTVTDNVWHLLQLAAVAALLVFWHGPPQ